MLAAEWGLLNVFWAMLGFFLFVMWLMLVFTIFGDLFRDHSVSGISKALWSLLIIFLPYLGVFLYLIVRGSGMAERNAKDVKAAEDEFRTYLRENAGTATAAEQLATLSDLHDRNKISDEEYENLKAKVIS